MMQGAQIIVLATPAFLLLMALEWWIGVKRGRNTYRAADAMSSVGLGMLSQVAGVFSKLLTVGIYTALFAHVSVWNLSESSWWVWPVALVLYDFLYYWHHRFGHTVALFWAAHVVHHQSEDYNLSTALRQTGSGWLIGWVFYVPMAVLGFPPVVFGTVALIDLLYQFWVHTQQIHKLGWFDRVFCSPSNHRVHHAVNDVYVDRNYGGILVVWDRLFGSFQAELDREPCVYGTRTPLRSFNPLWANVEVYAALAKDSWRARSWGDTWRVWFKPPGWRPADVAASDPKAPFSLQSRTVFESRASSSTMWIAAALFALGLSATAVFLWTAHTLAPAVAVGWALVILALLWSVGALLARSHAINVGAGGDRHAIRPQRLS